MTRAGQLRQSWPAWLRALVLCLFALAGAARLAAAEVEPAPKAKEPPAKIRVSGYGILGNRQLLRTLSILDKPGAKPVSRDANFIEDSALILLSQARKDGYLAAKLAAELTLADGRKIRHEWGSEPGEPLPRPLAVARAEFTIHPGAFYALRKIGIDGSKVVPEKRARGYFVETDTLVRLRKTRVYTPQKLRDGLNNFAETLERQGYESASVTATNLLSDPATGETDVTIVVWEGKKSLVRSIREEVWFGHDLKPSVERTVSTNTPYSKLWRQDYAQAVRRTYYLQGYADAAVEIVELRREEAEGTVHIDFLARVRTGLKITIGEIAFAGQKQTKEKMMLRRVKIEEGELLDPVKAEQGRFRLAQLGIFDTVEMDYQKVDEETRDILYRVKEGKHVDVSLLFGYGSYEQVRGGFDIDQFNVFGRGHHARLRVVQSLKSSSADYLYSMPELVGRDVDVFFNATGLRRQEISFTREEFGGGVGAVKFFSPIHSTVSLRYNYQVLNAADLNFNIAEGLKSADVGSVILDVKRDLRDNPLYPRKGYKVFTTLETASQYLGGDVDFQRLETAASYHLPIFSGEWLHLGVSHGLVVTSDGPQRDLPFNKRFFPGGENSVRGYQQGEASPRNDSGKIVGAETFTVANFEFEQGLTRSWSVIAFLDSIGFAKSIDHYPFDTGLFSVGAGIRWKTIIGPARLEYGYNLNPRVEDPVGTLHFSVGFPF